jgi:hypothetical protein
MPARYKFTRHLLPFSSIIASLHSEFDNEIILNRELKIYTFNYLQLSCQVLGEFLIRNCTTGLKKEHICIRTERSAKKYLCSPSDNTWSECVRCAHLETTASILGSVES